MSGVSRFDDPALTFDAASHQYIWNGWPLTSVTTFIKSLHKPFDAQTHSTRVAARRKCTQAEILAEWEAKRNSSAALGTAVHAEAERLLHCLAARREFVAMAPPGLGGPESGYVRAVHSFLAAHHELAYQPLWPEVRICHPAWGLAGTVDLICHLDGVPAILDWKTSKSIDFEGYSQMLPPLECYTDCNFVHYALQLSTYATILRDRYGFDAQVLALVQLKPDGTYEDLRVNVMCDAIAKISQVWGWEFRT